MNKLSTLSGTEGNAAAEKEVKMETTLWKILLLCFAVATDASAQLVCC
jgi:hypothetical protein